MRSILVINPNTTAGVSALLQQHGNAMVGPDVRLDVATARFGAPYIACEASYAIAGHAVLDAWARQVDAAPPDAVLIGCFGDPGLFALQEAGVPVTGLAAASAQEAAAHGRFAIVTGGARWEPMLRRLMHSLGFAEALAGILTVAPSGAELARDPQGAQALLAGACREAVSRFGVQAVVVGGAGLAGMAQRIAPGVDVPLIDSVAAGLRGALRLCGRNPADHGAQRERLAAIRPWLAPH